MSYPDADRFTREGTCHEDFFPFVGCRSESFIVKTGDGECYRLAGGGPMVSIIFSFPVSRSHFPINNESHFPVKELIKPVGGPDIKPQAKALTFRKSYCSMKVLYSNVSRSRSSRNMPHMIVMHSEPAKP